MRKIIAILFLSLGLLCVGLPFLPVGCSDDKVTASADTEDSTNSVSVPLYMTGIDSPAILLFPFDFRYGYITSGNPFPPHDTIALIYTDGLPLRETFTELEFDSPKNVYFYDFSMTTWHNLSVLMLPYIYYNNEWVRAETVPSVLFSLENKYATRCNINRVDDVTFDSIYYFQADTSTYSQGDCQIFFRFTFVQWTPSTLYNATVRLGSIFMSRPYNPESYNIGYNVGYQDGFAEGEIQGRDEAYTDGYDYGYKVGFGDGWVRGEEDGYDKGYVDGVSAGLSDVTPWDLLVQQIDAFFNLSLFGSSVTFGTVLSIGFGMLLMGIAIKIFMGG